MEEKVSGILVGSVNYGENDKILNVFSLEKGMISARIKGVKKAGAKLKFATEPFCFAEYVFSVNANKRVVTGASLLDSFYPLREDITKYFSAGCIIEYTKKFLKEGIVSKDFFFLVLKLLKEIAYEKSSPKYSLLKFLFSALTLSGYGLNVKGCSVCGKKEILRPFFDYQTGSFFCENCNDNYREINVLTYSALNKLAEDKELSDLECDYCLRLIDYYLTNKAEVKLKSLQELIRLS